jgi:cytochrome c5
MFYFKFLWFISFFFVLQINFVFAAKQVIIIDNTLSKIELGQYYDDKPLSYNFFLKNQGVDKVENLTIETSCGCTTALTPRKFISSGKMMKVSIQSDLTGKRGIIYKEFVVNYKLKNIVKKKIITLSFSVVANIKAHHAKKLTDVLFNDKCGKCHATPAVGKKGKALFKAVCGFCHGKNGGGASARGFTSVEYMKNFNPKLAKNIIEKGTTDESMPGFLNDHGGPLNAEQVDSLIQYFLNRKKDYLRFIN